MSKGLTKVQQLQAEVRSGERTSFTAAEVEALLRNLRQWEYMALLNHWKDERGEPAAQNIHLRF